MERHRVRKLPGVSASSAAAESGVLAVLLARFVDVAVGVKGKPQTSAVAMLVEVEVLIALYSKPKHSSAVRGRVMNRLPWA